MIVLSCGAILMPIREGNAARNLIDGGDFESNIERNWVSWQDSESERTYESFRSYERQVGSYSIGIEAAGSPDEHWDAGIVTADDFQVETGKDYYLIFYAKGSTNFNIATFVQNSDTYVAVTPIEEVNVSTDWEKHVILFSPNASVRVNLSFVYGEIPNGAILNIDGVQFVESNIVSSTKGIKGHIGDQKKYIALTNIGNFTEEDIELEVPYYDNTTGESGRRRFNPVSMTNKGAYFNIEEQTFSGVAEVFVNNVSIKTFDYIVLPKITEYSPALLRGDADLTVFGSGFIPGENRTFIVVNVTGTDGKINEQWLPAENMDSSLSQATVRLPVNVTGGKIYVYVGYMMADETEGSNKSNYLSYKVKPIVHNVDWNQRGYEQVGDKLVIRGRGFGVKPYVNFYDSDGVKVDTKVAKKTEITDTEELITVDATTKINSFDITVMSGGIESDTEDAISQLAKPNFTAIRSNHSRTVYSTSEKIYASKIGEEITLIGEGFGTTEDAIIVEFQGINTRIPVTVASENIAENGKSVKVIVPAGAQNGYINIETHGEESNYRPIEIIPTVLNINPNPIVPGETFTILAQGVGDNLNLLKVHFKVSNNEEIEISPDSINFNDNQASIVVRAPFAVSSQSSSVNLQYDRWKDDGDSSVSVNPTITSASINMDNKILTIRGYGFSVSLKENEIIYKYADQDRTTISPNVKMLGVYPTEEGQEIRIKINDEYHYGYVQVRTGGQLSNEVNFGPASISKITRRVEYVEVDDAVRGVLYINGYNFGESGGVRVGDVWADVHYRTEYFIIAVVDEEYLYNNPITVTRD